MALALTLVLSACEADTRAPPRAAKPDLALLTSLPIAFGESFGLDQQRSPLLEELENSFVVTPVDGPEQLRLGGLLFAAQPQALTAERLVALDKWVRDGGRLLLLADPVLTFDSSRPLGDRFRPPLRYPDTGLLAHWGLLLDESTDSRLEEVNTDLGRGIRLTASRLGSLTRAGGDCTLSPTRVVARCRIGKGYATVVADADFALSPEPGREDQKAITRLLQELAVVAPQG
jgi:hypothetical protein